MAGKSTKRAAATKNTTRKPRKATAQSSDQMSASRRIDQRIAALGDWRGESEGDRMDKTALGALLREAVAYNARHSVHKSKGSRV
jgi:hypothetical protein